jgi:rRNA maturation RNase YbeY
MTKKTNSTQNNLSKASSRGFCSIVRVGTRGRLPVVSYEAIRDAILGNHYNLTIAYVDEKTSEDLHIKWKHAPGPANILSFPYSDSEGEIILHLPTVYKKSSEFDHSRKQHLVFLIIHGCLHLAGHTHGHIMDKEEKRFMEMFRVEW